MSISFSDEANDEIITTAASLPEDRNEGSLRPKTIREYIGQQAASQPEESKAPEAETPAENTPAENTEKAPEDYTGKLVVYSPHDADPLGHPACQIWTTRWWTNLCMQSHGCRKRCRE